MRRKCQSLNYRVSPFVEGFLLKTSLRTSIQLICVAAFVATSALAVVGIGVSVLSARDSASHDVISYWAAAQQLDQHGNPYNQSAILKIERAQGFPPDTYPLMMRNPPWTFPVVLPLAGFTLRTASILWSVLLACSLAVTLLNLPPPVRIGGICFAPVLGCIVTGQTGVLCLAGMLLFMKLHRDHLVLAGASLWLCAFKPHLFIPFLFVLAAWIVFTGSYRVVYGLGATLAASLLFALFFDKHLLHQYARMISHIGPEFVPTIGNALRFKIGDGAIWLQWVPAVAASIWAIWFWERRRFEWKWEREGCVLAALSVVVAPYAWYSDLAIMLPALGLAVRDSRVLFAAMLVNSAMLVQILFGVSMHSPLWLWCGPAWLFLILLERPVKPAALEVEAGCSHDDAHA